MRVSGRTVKAVHGKTQADEEFVVSRHRVTAQTENPSENQQCPAPTPRQVGADDAMTDVACTKGAWFLQFLEQRFARETFDAYLRGCFGHFAFQCITTEQMLDYLRAPPADKYPATVHSEEIEQWVYTSGPPDSATLPDMHAPAAVDAARQAFLGGTLSPEALPGAAGTHTKGCTCLTSCPTRRRRDEAWALSRSGDAEFGMRCPPRAISAGNRDDWPVVRAYMPHIGCMKLTLPIFRAFAGSAEGLAYAEAACRGASRRLSPTDTARHPEGAARGARGSKAGVHLR